LAVAATAQAESAWVLWEHFTGVLDNKAEDFWLLREATESRAECLQRAEQEVKLETGDHPEESLLGLMLKADRETIRPGWTRRVTTPWAWEERAPEGKGGFLHHKLECWPSGTDPRPRSKE
jgi:hypothetical protein